MSTVLHKPAKQPRSENAMDYYVRKHDGHFHVLHEDQEPVLDDRLENPWLFKYEATALDVARRLNEGETPYEVRHTIEESTARVTDGRY